MRTSCVEAPAPPRPAVRTIGPDVPAGPFAFRVHSLFATAVNLRPEGHQRLVTLTGCDADDLPQGVRLATRERFDAWPLRTGMRGRMSGDVLVFEGRPGAESVRVELAGATRAPRRPLAAVSFAAPGWRARWRECAAALDALQAERCTDLRLASLVRGHAPATACGTRLAEAALQLGAGVRANDVAAADAAAARLLGLGPGLTPAGDDYLCGLLAALWSASEDDREARRFVLAWGFALSRRLHATNAVSATYLECAIAGSFSGALHALAAALAGSDENGSSGSPRTALVRACAAGHSSGMDTATGFLHGLRLRGDQESRRHVA